jgi:rRNA-processing protein FCF1
MVCLMTTVILDTNALMMPFQFGVNLDLELERLFGSFEILVPSSVLQELRSLAPTDNVARSAVRLARKYKTVESEGETDKVLVDLAKELNAVVVSNDKLVIRSLEREGLPYVRLRSRSHLILEGSL